VERKKDRENGEKERSGGAGGRWEGGKRRGGVTHIRTHAKTYTRKHTHKHIDVGFGGEADIMLPP